MLNPDLAEKRDADESFARWQKSCHAHVSDTAMEKRKNELYALVRKVIRNELTPLQQQIVYLLWYENKTVVEAAKALCVDKATIYRKEKQINAIIYDKLKYAMEYRFGKSFSEKTVELIHSNAAACCPVEGKSVSQRLRALRLKQNLSNGDISSMTGIKKSRLDYLEQEGECISVHELAKLASLYSTTTDYIITGKRSD